MSDNMNRGKWTPHGGGIVSWRATDGTITYYGKYTDLKGVRRKRRLKAISLKQARLSLSEIKDSIRAHPTGENAERQDAADALELAEQFLHALYVTPAIAKEQRQKRGK